MMIALLLKPAPALVCAALAARAPSHPSARYRTLFVLALLCGAVGDGLLGRDMFVPGLVAFLVGHVLYAAAFAFEGARPRTASLAGPALVGALLVAALWPRLGDMRVPVLSYVVAIATMSSLAIDLWRRSRHHMARRAALGACFFVVSDTFIAIDKFHTPLGPPLLALAIFSTYYVAQFLLAWSVGSHRAGGVSVFGEGDEARGRASPPLQLPKSPDQVG